jgi:hypothetical protein
MHFAGLRADYFLHLNKALWQKHLRLGGNAGFQNGLII